MSTAPSQYNHNPPKLLEQVASKCRVKHYSIRTERTYVDWAKRYILFHGKRHPKEMGAAEIEAYLSHLAVAGHVSASTQNQAKSALLFLYKEVLAIELPFLDKVTQAKAPIQDLRAWFAGRIIENQENSRAIGLKRWLSGLGRRTATQCNAGAVA